MLSSLDSSDLMGGDQKALTDFIANYFEQEKTQKVSYFSSSKKTSVNSWGKLHKSVAYYTWHSTHRVCARVKVLYWKVMYKTMILWGQQKEIPTLLEEFDPDGNDALRQ